MGVSTDGHISYGIPFEEGQDFPWGEYEFEQWWYQRLGFKYSFECYDEKGDYLPGMTHEDARRRYDEYDAFKKIHGKPPFDVINYCSDSCPMYMIVLRRTYVCAKRGYPSQLDPSIMQVSPEERQTLIDFCRENIPQSEYPKFPPLEPQWYLSSYWST